MLLQLQRLSQAMEIVKYKYKPALKNSDAESEPKSQQQALWFIGSLEKKSPLVDITC